MARGVINFSSKKAQPLQKTGAYPYLVNSRYLGIEEGLDTLAHVSRPGLPLASAVH